MNIKPCLRSTLLAVGFPTLLAAEAETTRISIDRVPGGFPVGFSLLTHGTRQHVAYYDSDHRMTVASRKTGSKKWVRTHLPSKIGWDSHNYITMVVDDDGHLHLSGNMHCVPLVYFRTTRPGDITSFVRVPNMVGPEEEQRCTYPKFMRGPDQELIFHYRTGSSGKGNEIYNVYDHETRTWSRLLDQPLTDGQGRMNAYMHGPIMGPDGFFHLVWVWRDTPDCATNHDLSHARSRDLRSWETIAGAPIALPLTIADERLIVDPVPPGGGIINGCARIGFDSRSEPVITYHKNDENGVTQAYAARFRDGRWMRRQLTRWTHPWTFRGGGSIPFGIRLSASEAWGHGRLKLGFSHLRHGKGTVIFDEETLLPLRPGDPRRRLPGPPETDTLSVPSSLAQPVSTFPGMTVRWAGDTGDACPSVLYRLRWETLPSNRDRRRPGEHPAPSLLELIEIRQPGS